MAIRENHSPSAGPRLRQRRGEPHGSLLSFRHQAPNDPGALRVSTRRSRLAVREGGYNLPRLPFGSHSSQRSPGLAPLVALWTVGSGRTGVLAAPVGPAGPARLPDRLSLYPGCAGRLATHHVPPGCRHDNRHGPPASGRPRADASAVLPRDPAVPSGALHRGEYAAGDGHDRLPVRRRARLRSDPAVPGGLGRAGGLGADFLASCQAC